MNTPHRLDAHTLRRLAVTADVDPRTVARVIAGKAVQRVCRTAVVAALRAHGLDHLAPAEACAEERASAA